MGLLTCEKCGKIYDYDKYNGICPKCARYNRANSSAAEHQEYHNKYDGGYSHSEQDDHHSFHQRYDSNKIPHEEPKTGGTERKTVKLILGIIAVIFISTLPVLGFLSIPIAVGAAVYMAKKKNK